jgi:hypothetical protein
MVKTPAGTGFSVVGLPGFEPGTSSLSGMNRGFDCTYEIGRNPCDTRDISSHYLSLFRVVSHSLVHAMCTRRIVWPEDRTAL